ncbi:hypothetical protein niasHT_037372 [Heterodera trifolii]|uniref:Uncharacterized protein n=1 Tax=Heterodera trifolii TaxID=157864 RepID=A0ABD2J589_9BILA
MPATGSMVADWIRTGLINAVFKQFAFVSKLITALLIVRLLLIARFRPAVLSVPELSHALRTFLFFHLAAAIVTMPYNAYVPIAYYTEKSYDDTVQKTQPIYNYSVLFWLGHFHNTYTAISPLVVLFLTLERCFVIKLATKPATMARVERWLGWAGIGTLLAAFTASTCFYIDELPLNISLLNEINCQSVSCLMLKWNNIPQLVFKCTISILNIFGCSYLLYSFHTISSAMIKKKNRYVIVTICFAIILDFFPALVNIVFDLFNLGFIGNFGSTCTVLDSLCCAIYFSLVFVPPGRLKRGGANNANAIGGTTNIQQQRQHTQLQPQQRTNRVASTVSMMSPIIVPALNRHPPISRYSDGMVQIGTVSATVRHGR